MANENKKEIRLVTAAAPPKESMRGIKDEARKVIEEGVSVEKLQRGFQSFVESLGEIIQSGYTTVGDFNLDEISFSAEIGASGDFKLLGAGVGLSAGSAVTFKLRRAGANK